MSYEKDLTAWEATVPDSITRDSLWRMRVYRLALFASDRGWEDVSLLLGDSRTRGLADQLYRALGSIGANIAEGVGRGSFKDNRRFVKIGRGSLYEVKHWLRRAYRRDLLTKTKCIVSSLSSTNSPPGSTPT